jgi:hypothetical protein
MTGHASKPNIYVSYARDAGKIDPLVQNLCKTLHEEDGIEVKWDASVEHGTDFNRFYNSLSSADILLIVIRERYFYSPYCMIKELMPAFNYNDFNHAYFLQRAIFLVLECAEKYLADPVRNGGKKHPLKGLKKHWSKAINKVKTFRRKSGNNPDIANMSRLGKEDYLLQLIEMINMQKTIRGKELIEANNFAEVRSLLQERIAAWHRQESPMGGKTTKNAHGKLEWEKLVAGSVVDWPAGESGPVSAPSPQTAPSSASLYLMVQIEETGEPNRLCLIPELQMHPTINTNRSDLPEPIRAAEDELHADNNITLATGVGEAKHIGVCLKEWLGVANRAAAALSSRPDQPMPVVLELFVPFTLLHHDYGDIQIPATLEPRPLGANYAYMVRSLDRARDHAGIHNRLHDLRSKSCKPGEIRQIVLVSCCQEISLHSNSSDMNPWYTDLYTITQEKDVGTCIIFPCISDQPKDLALLKILVDSWLPLVVFWPEASRSSSAAPGGRDQASINARLAFVRKLLDASDLLELPSFDTRGISVPKATINRLRLDHVAHQRKELRCIGVREDDLISRHAIVLMDDPDRWPHRLITASG